MSENRIKGRIVNKHDIEANWNLALNFKPMLGEIIIYDADDTHQYPRMKIGDGETVVSSLPFFDDAIKAYMQAYIAEYVETSILGGEW